MGADKFVLDVMGVQILPGDKIGYAVRQGNSGEMRVYEVVDVIDGKLKAKPLENENAAASEKVVTLFGPRRQAIKL